MAEAQAVCASAARDVPDDGFALYLNARIEFGLGKDLDAFAQSANEALLREPDYFPAAQLLTFARCEKWYGSHDAMFEFARESAADPQAPSLAGLIPLAHAERWFYMAAWEQGSSAANQYFAAPAVQEEISAAFARLVPEGAQTVGAFGAAAANWFAFAFARIRDVPRLRAALALLEGRATPTPWGYGYGDEFKAIKKLGGV